MTRPYERVSRWARSIALLSFGSTAASGIGLWYAYQPTPGALGRMLVIVHLVSIVVAAQAVVATSVIGLLGSKHPSETARRVLGLVVSLLAFSVSALTGTLLGWDQLALYAVTVGSQFQGYGWVLGDEVKFAVINDTVVGVDTIQRLLIVHIGSALVIVVASVVVPWFVRRRDVPSDT